MQKIIKCQKSECQSLDIWFYGFYYQKGEKKQKYKCKKCGYVWSEKY